MSTREGSSVAKPLSRAPQEDQFPAKIDRLLRQMLASLAIEILATSKKETSR
jgi:hypothetical protein